MICETKSSGDYTTNCAWFRDVLQNEDVVLRGISALEYLELFSGYLNEKRIEVYAMQRGKYDNVDYRIVESYDKIAYSTIGGVRCVSLNQVVQDMLNDWDNADAQALTEALSNYYFTHDKSFDGLSVEGNESLLEEIKGWAVEYYNN